MDKNHTLKEDVAISPEGNVSDTPSMTALKENFAISPEGNVQASNTSSGYWNKAGCAVTGGLITAVGLVMIPAPTPCGCIVTAYGLTILGREFEGAQKVVEGTKENLERGLDAWAKDWGKEEEDGGGGVKETDATRQKTFDAEEISQGGEDDISDSKDESCNKETEGASSLEEVACMNDAHKALLEQQMDEKVEKQSPLDAWGKAWNSHTRNFRKGTSSFISGKLLPALRDLDLTNKKKKATTPGSISEDADAVIVQLDDNEKMELSKALGELDLKCRKENVTSMDSIEEDAVIVQIGDNEDEKIVLSKEEIEMIKGTIDNETSSETANTSLVPDYAESLVSDSSQSNGGDVEDASWVRNS